MVFEGLDRCGKSTQSNLLREHLKADFMCYPKREGTTGQLLDSFLKNKSDMCNESVHLLFAMNRWEYNNQLIDKLNQGVNIVCDRYAYSGVAYSAAKGLDFEWCLGADRGMLRPDFVFYMDVKAEETAKREGFGDERFEKQDF